MSLTGFFIVITFTLMGTTFAQCKTTITESDSLATVQGDLDCLKKNNSYLRMQIHTLSSKSDLPSKHCSSNFQQTDTIGTVQRDLDCLSNENSELRKLLKLDRSRKAAADSAKLRTEKLEQAAQEQEQADKTPERVELNGWSQWYGHENDDLGVPTQDSPFPGVVGGSTPTEIPGGRVISTDSLRSLLTSRLWVSYPSVTLIDVWAYPHEKTIKAAIRLPYAGVAYSDESGEKDLQDRLTADILKARTGGKNMPVIFFCLGPSCRESFNASIRAIHAGFTDVLWYRGGVQTWELAGFEEEE